MNIAADEIPWANIINKQVLNNKIEFLSAATIIILMWPTEEYAMSILLSMIRIHKNLASTPPTIATHLKILIKTNLCHSTINRNIPYPPSFRSKDARIIDPPTGAST